MKMAASLFLLQLCKYDLDETVSIVVFWSHSLSMTVKKITSRKQVLISLKQKRCVRNVQGRTRSTFQAFTYKINAVCFQSIRSNIRNSILGLGH